MYSVLFLSFPVFLGFIISCLFPVLLPVFFCLSSLCLAPPSFYSPTSDSVQLCVNQPSVCTCSPVPCLDCPFSSCERLSVLTVDY